MLHVPDERLGCVLLGLLARGRAVHHRERRGLVVDELADRLGALGEAAAVQREPVTQLLGRHAHRERAQTDAVATDLAVSVGAARRTPDRRVRVLERLRLHAARRAHLPVLAVGLVVLLRPRRRCGAAPHSTSRVSCGSTPKPSSSARVDERPVPNSTRPSESRSSTATDSAVRIGWLYGFGSSRTP